MAGDGERPRNVSISPDGNLAVVTSMGSNRVTIVSTSQPLSVDQQVDVTAPTWGATFLDDGRIVLTHPGSTFLSVLTQNGPNFSRDEVTVPLYCTEVIRGTQSDRVLVACRGKAPAGAAAWQHAVYEVDVDATPPITLTIATEREPRALAVSPDGSTLFVGHAQGALGQDGIGTEVSFTGHPSDLFDGGSIVSFSLTTGSAKGRFAVGSPVRDLEVVAPLIDPTTGGVLLGYRLFFTHVGDGAQSEDPALGGRAIPNVVSSILFDLDNRADQNERQDVVFDHAPDLEFSWNPGNHTQQPSVVPEKLASRWDDQNERWEVWVSHSSSGTVSRMILLPDGTVDSFGSVNIVSSGGPLPVVTGRSQAVFIQESDVLFVGAGDGGQNATIDYDVVANPYHILVDPVSMPAVPFSSHPRGLTWDPVHERLYVVTEFDDELIQIDPAATASPIVGRVDVCTSCTIVDPPERNFFTFGSGFDFREDPGPRVNTLSCSTCHVEGHIDGKVRLTVNPQPGVDGKAVAVPSVFDVGATEWLFFNGLKTVLDRQPEGGACNYCVTAGFFPDTKDFTDVVQSPHSPYAPSGGLSPQMVKGRSLFERMNCSRCHNGTVPGFQRTDFLNSEIPESGTGPLASPETSASARWLLHDATQVFITEITVNMHSARNKTNVGTEIAGTGGGSGIGINTPALGGAWDNAPYMHDGRYRTLLEVLDHTWVDPADQHLAAPQWTLIGAPDNIFDKFAAVTAPPLPVLDTINNAILKEPIHKFATHSHATPSGKMKVTDYLAANQYANAAGDLVSFIQAASSQTNLCNTSTGDPIQSVSISGSNFNYTASWNTGTLPIACRVRWAKVGYPYPADPSWTPVGTGHSIPISVSAPGNWKLLIEYDSPLCGFSDSHEATWYVPPAPPCRGCPDPHQASVDPVPVATRLLGNEPNPFNPNTTIRFEIAQAGRPEIHIYDVSGRLVRTTTLHQMPVGSGEWSWDGRDENNQSMASGIYYVQLRVGEAVDRLRIALVK